MDGSDVSAARPDATAQTTGASGSDMNGSPSSSARPKIPPPRRINADIIRDQKPGPDPSRPKILPPRRYAGAPSGPQQAVATQTLEVPTAPVSPNQTESPASPEQLQGVPKVDSSVDSAPVSSTRSQPAAAIPVSEPPRLIVPVAPVESPSTADQAVPAQVTEPSAAIPAAARVLTPVEEPPRESIPIEVITKTGPDADALPVQSPAADVHTEPPPASQAAEPAAMPEAVNQALKTLSASPAIGPAPTPALPSASTSEPQATPIPDAAPEPSNGEQKTEQPVDATPSDDSLAKVPASKVDVKTPAAPEPDVKKTTQSQADDEEVERTGCASCGGFHSSLDAGAFHASLGCANGQCIPGRPPCDDLDKNHDTFLGAFLANMYAELCCPDPCYQPTWEPGANASFFADYARPRTVTRFRYDNLENMVRPDRNQFWIQGVSNATKTNKGRVRNPAMRLQEIYLYQEAAGAMGSFFVEVPYRQINPNFMPTQAGFSDINFGVKSMFYDRELLQMSFQFRTFTPSGNATSNLGTGHFSLDPSIMASLKLAPDTFLQSQVGNWIPLGGNSKLQGGVLYWFTSLNQVVWRPAPNSPLIATLEMDGWSFEDGGYTTALKKNDKPVIRPDGGGVSYFNIGPGLRQSICNKLDFGGVLTFATNSAHWAQPWFRFEVRFLF